MPGAAQPGEQAGAAGTADLRGGDVAGQQVQPGLGGHIHYSFQAREDGHQQIPQPLRPAGLVGDDLGPAAGQQPQLDVDVPGRLHHPQVITHPDQVGDHGGVLRVAFVLAAPGALPGPVHRPPRHVHHRQPSGQQHRLSQGGDPAQDVDPGRGRAVLRLGRAHLIDQASDGLGGVAHRMAGQHLPGLGDLDHRPVRLLSDIDAHRNRHGSPPFLGIPDVQLLPAGLALHSDRSQPLISGQEETVRQGAEPPWPSTAAVMKAIPASPAPPDSLAPTRPSGTDQKGRAVMIV